MGTTLVGSCTPLLVQQAEIRITWSAECRLLNTAQFAVAPIQIRRLPSHRGRSARSNLLVSFESRVAANSDIMLSHVSKSETCGHLCLWLKIEMQATRPRRRGIMRLSDLIAILCGTGFPATWHRCKQPAM